MLHSDVEMNRSTRLIALLLFAVLIGVSAAGFTPRQQEEEAVVSIDNPQPGGAVQGLVLISGTISVEGFQSYLLAFSFSEESDPDWFTISEADTLDEDGILGEWDTSTLPDDTYDLRLIVTLADETNIETTISGVRVRNYSIIETDTPTPTPEDSPTATPEPEITNTPTPGITPSPTPLAPNPAEVTVPDLQSTLVTGGIAGAVLFVLLAAIWRLRQPK